MIQLQRLEGFYWVARTGGYARAARAFSYPITAPGVHQQVRRLEEELGEALFERMGKDSVVLTHFGQALWSYVAPFLEGLPHAVRSARAGQSGGVLRIQAASQILRHLMPGWIRRLQSKRPDIDVTLVENKDAKLEPLQRGETDLLVDYLPVVPPDVEVTVVGRVRAFFVFPLHRTRSKHSSASPVAFKDEPFVAYSEDRRHRALQMRALELSGISPPRVLSADTSETILAFVAAGLGYSFVPSTLPAGPTMPGVGAKPLKLPGADFPIYVAWRRSRFPNPLVKAALDVAPRPGR